MFSKYCLSALIAFGVSVSAYADDLTIVNDTDFDSTSIINNGACSSLFGSSGITKAHSTNVVSERLIHLACMLNSSNCKADVYLTNNCSGPIAGTVIFDVKSGIKMITVTNPTYNIEGSDFHIKISKA